MRLTDIKHPMLPYTVTNVGRWKSSILASGIPSWTYDANWEVYVPFLNARILKHAGLGYFAEIEGFEWKFVFDSKIVFDPRKKFSTPEEAKKAITSVYASLPEPAYDYAFVCRSLERHGELFDVVIYFKILSYQSATPGTWMDPCNPEEFELEFAKVEFDGEQDNPSPITAVETEAMQEWLLESGDDKVYKAVNEWIDKTTLD